MMLFHHDILDRISDERRSWSETGLKGLALSIPLYLLPRVTAFLLYVLRTYVLVYNFRAWVEASVCKLKYVVVPSGTGLDWVVKVDHVLLHFLSLM